MNARFLGLFAAAAGCTLAYTSACAADNPTTAAPKPAQTAKPTFKQIELRGKVVPYQDALKRLYGIKLAGDQAAKLLALETEDGRLEPIVPTDGGRFFYQDPAMLDRPVQIVARVYDKTPGLQVIKVYSIRDGKLNEIYYWCSICAIKMYQLRKCECCQGDVEVREHPVGEPYRIRNK